MTKTLIDFRPCILLFDSLGGPLRHKVVATLRDYLTCEYKVKVNEPSDYTFNKDNIRACNVKVPQQTNFTDCGLYLLQYVEQFFKVSRHCCKQIIPPFCCPQISKVSKRISDLQDPITDYRIPIKQLKNWFETIVVTKKREDIANLIKELIEEHGTYSKVKLPEIQLPTENGKLLDLAEFTEEHGEFEEEELEADAEEVSIRFPYFLWMHFNHLLLF